MTARVVSVVRNAGAGALLRALGDDRLVAYMGVDAGDRAHYYVAAPRGSVPTARRCAEALAEALNRTESANVGAGGD